MMHWIAGSTLSVGVPGIQGSWCQHLLCSQRCCSVHQRHFGLHGQTHKRLIQAAVLLHRCCQVMRICRIETMAYLLWRCSEFMKLDDL